MTGCLPAGQGTGVCECVCVRSCHPLILVLRAGIVSLVTCSRDSPLEASIWALLDKLLPHPLWKHVKANKRDLENKRVF